MPELSMSAAIRKTLGDLLRTDENVFLLGEDIGVYGGAFKITRGFVEEFGANRVIDTPIAECGIVSVACGAALMGSRPIVEIMFMDFLMLAMDGLVNSAVKWREIYGDDYNMPIIIRTPAGGGRSYGPTHSQSFEGLLMNVPGLNISCPSNAADAAGMLLGLYNAEQPGVFVEHKAIYEQKCSLPDPVASIAPGKGRIVRHGNDISLISYGRPLHTVLKAAAQLEDAGISAEVIDLRSLRPLDRELIVASMSRTGKGICIEESPVCGGVGSEVAAVVMEYAFDYLEAPFVRMGATDGAIPCARRLEQQSYVNVADIVARTNEAMAY